MKVGNPCEGGCWETMMRTVKRVLCYSSRPLTHVPINVTEDEPLTQNHFILGSANRVQTPSIYDKPNTNLRNQRSLWSS
uniref:Uncharacterized protein n=1 Tax=Megaselia scalaris TaxID=36166 RepID=T1GIR8_MEGSC